MSFYQSIARFLLTVFIGSYAIGIFQPYLPAINDFVQHTFNEVKHIGTIHLENGKYHVHKEEAKIIKTENKKDQNEKTDTLKKIDVHLFETAETFTVKSKLCGKKSCFCFSKTLILRECDTPHRPPQQLV